MNKNSTIFNDLIIEYPEHREEAEERAGIMEFDGGLNREAAELETVRLIKNKYGIVKQEELF